MGRDEYGNALPQIDSIAAPYLLAARNAANKAWNLDPTRPMGATQMLRIARYYDFVPEAVETWYRRAMAADPDNYIACYYRLDFLRIRGKDDRSDQLAFGRECLAYGTAANRISNHPVESPRRLWRHIPRLLPHPRSLARHPNHLHQTPRRQIPPPIRRRAVYLRDRADYLKHALCGKTNEFAALAVGIRR